MSRPVDEKIVKIRLENPDFKAKADETISIFAKLKDALNKIPGVNIGKTSQDIANIGKEADRVNMGRLTSAVETLGGKFSALGIIGITALQNIANEAINSGKQLVESFTGLEGIKSGFSEYELKMEATQTIMAGSGEDLEVVNTALKELNDYADQTIYSFKDMTSNIGKFTNAGVGLDKSVKAIQGVSNVAAISGANAQEASNAMYNFAQALSSGSVKNIDWKSIETANMATKGFKDQLIATALEMGTLEETADGMFKSTTTNAMGNTSKAFNATKMFREELESQWLTTDVLIETLGNYSDETTEIGKKAFAAAKDVKTFTQLIAVTKESIGSGWSQSWEIIIGDFTEAKTLWGGLNNVISGAVGKSADARNKFLQAFKDAGGINNTVRGVGNVFNSFRKILGAVSGAFRSVFPKKSVNELVKVSAGFEKLTSHLIVSDEATVNIREAFSKLFGAVKSGLGYVKQFGTMLVGLFPQNFGSKVWDTVVDLGDLTGAFVESLDIGSKVPKVIEGIGEVFIWLGEKLKMATNFIKEAFDKVKNAFSGVKTPELESSISLFEKLSDKLKELSPAFDTAWTSIKKFFEDLTAQDILSGGMLVVTFGFIKKLVEFLDILKSPKDFKKSIAPVLDTISNSVNAFTKNTPYDHLMKVALAIFTLAVSIKLLESIKTENVGSSLAILGVSLAGIIGVMAIMDKLKFKDLKSAGLITTIIAIGVTVLIMATAIKKISSVDPERLNGAVTATIKLFGALVLAFLALALISKYLPNSEGIAKTFNKFASSMIKTGIAIAIFALGFQLMAGALEKIGKINPDELGQGLMTVLAIILAFGVMQAISSGSSIGTGVSFAIIAMSLGLLVKPLQDLGSMNMDVMKQGLLGISAVLVMVAASLYLAQGGLSGAVGMLIVVGVMKLLLPIVKEFGELDLGKMVQGIGAIVVVALGLAAALAVASKGGLEGAGSILMTAIAIKLLISPIIALANLPFWAVVGALGALAGVFVIMYVAVWAFTPVIATLVTFAWAVKTLGVGLVLGAVAFAIFGPALAAFAVIVGASIMLIIAAIGSVLDSISWLAPKIENSFVQLIIMLCSAIIKSVPWLVDAIGILLLGIIIGLAKYIPPVVDALTLTVVVFIEALVAALEKYGPRLTKAVLKLLGELIYILIDAFIALVDVLIGGIPGVSKKLAGMSKGLREAADEMFDGETLGGGMVEDVAEGVGGGGALLEEAGGKAAESTASGFSAFDFKKLGIGAGDTTTTGFNTTDFFGTGKGGVDGLLDGFLSEDMKASLAANGLGDTMMDTFGKLNFGSSGEKAVEGIVKGVHKATPRMQSTGKELATIGRNAYDSVKTDNSGYQFVEGIIRGMISRKNRLAAVAGSLGTTSVRSLNRSMEVESPSKATTRSGRFFGDGLIIGMKDRVRGVKSAAAEMASKATESMNAFIGQFAGTFEKDNEYSVKLKPVLDLDGLGVIPNQTYGITPDTSRTGNLFNQVAYANSQNGDKTLQTIQKGEFEIHNTVDVNVSIEGADGLMDDYKFVEKLKTIVANDVITGNRTLPNRTSLMQF